MRDPEDEKSSNPSLSIANCLLQAAGCSDLNNPPYLAAAIERALSSHWKRMSAFAHQIHDRDRDLEKAARNLAALDEDGFKNIASGDATAWAELLADMELIIERAKRKTT